MRVAIPVNENNNNTEICPSFGRAPFYLIYDTVLKEHDYMLNPAADAQGGAGIKASQFLVDLKIDAVIAPRMGKNSSDVLLPTGIKLYKSISDHLQENIDAYEVGSLHFLSDFHPGFHGNGG